MCVRERGSNTASYMAGGARGAERVDASEARCGIDMCVHVCVCEYMYMYVYM